jgi:hypothetical protein
LDNVYFDDEGPSEITETEANQNAAVKDALANEK